MDVKEFEYLVMIADLGSITKAANQLYLTQSALSKFVQKKEEEMGTPLFSRIGKQFVPTYAGERCIEAARQVLSINRRLSEDVEQITKNGKGRIRLAFHSSWSDFFFMRIYPHFEEQHPNVNLQLFEANSYDSLEMMDRGELDLAVITATWNRHSRYACEPLRTQHMVLAVREGHPLLEKAEKNPDYPFPLIDLKNLQDMPLILRQSSQKTRAYAMELLHAREIESRVVMETASRENALRAVEYGIGVTFTLDDPTMLLMHRKIRYLSFADENPESYINIIYHRGAYFSDAETDLVKLIKNHYHIL